MTSIAWYRSIGWASAHRQRNASVRPIERKLPLIARIPAAAVRTEHRARRHRAAIDVQRHRSCLVARIQARVVLVRRDQAARGAGPGIHRAARLEAVFAVSLLDQLVRRDLERAGPDAFD